MSDHTDTRGSQYTCLPVTSALVFLLFCCVGWLAGWFSKTAFLCVALADLELRSAWVLRLEACHRHLAALVLKDASEWEVVSVCTGCFPVQKCCSVAYQVIEYLILIVQSATGHQWVQIYNEQSLSLLGLSSFVVVCTWGYLTGVLEMLNLLHMQFFA